MRTVAGDPRSYDVSGVRRATEQLDLMLSTEARDELAFPRAELHCVRMTIAASRENLALAVLNSVGQIFLEVPAVVWAMNEELPLHVAFWKTLVETWEKATMAEAGVDLMEQAVRARDETTVRRFHEHVSTA